MEKKIIINNIIKALQAPVIDKKYINRLVTKLYAINKKTKEASI